MKRLKLSLNFLSFTVFTLVTLIAVTVLILAMKGLYGNPSEQDLNSPHWRENGVFELSPERGRFALTYSIVENASVQFTEGIARFAVPDVATYNGTYVSLFAPAVSYILAPGYLVGKVFNLAQVGTTSIISLFAIGNFVLIFLVAKKLGAHYLAALLGALTFLFASPAFAYGVNLYQHHISTFIILLAIYFLISKNSVLSNAKVFLLCGISVAVDYPNFFFMLPVGLLALSRVVEVVHASHKLHISIQPLKLLSGLIIIIPLLLLMWFQASSYGSPFRLSGSLATAKFDLEESINLNDLASIPEDIINGEKDTTSRDKNVLTFFESRGILNAFYLHFFSPDRGMLMYTPSMFLGFVGLVFAYRRNIPYFSLLASVLFMVIVLYSLWGDPWGGWAFGSRYLVPAYGILGIFIALLLTYFRKSVLVLAIYLTLTCYSMYVNTTGALTTIALPPKVEVLALEALSGRIQRYSYDRGTEMLDQNISKSFIYNQVGVDHLTAWQYFYLVFGILVTTTSLVVLALRLSKPPTL